MTMPSHGSGRLPSALLTLAVLATLATPLAAQKSRRQPAARQSADSLAAAKIVDGYHAALTAGDSLRALSLLTTDAVILESGGIETLAEYRAHHLPADIAFAKAVRSEAGPLSVRVQGRIAWTWRSSRTTGTYGGRAVDSSGVESMLLIREAAGWRIAQIHWSSRARRPEPGGQ